MDPAKAPEGSNPIEDYAIEASKYISSQREQADVAAAKEAESQPKFDLVSAMSDEPVDDIDADLDADAPEETEEVVESSGDDGSGGEIQSDDEKAIALVAKSKEIGVKLTLDAALQLVRDKSAADEDDTQPLAGIPQSLEELKNERAERWAEAKAIRAQIREAANNFETDDVDRLDDELSQKMARIDELDAAHDIIAANEARHEDAFNDAWSKSVSEAVTLFPALKDSKNPLTKRVDELKDVFASQLRANPALIVKLTKDAALEMGVLPAGRGTGTKTVQSPPRPQSRTVAVTGQPATAPGGPAPGSARASSGQDSALRKIGAIQTVEDYENSILELKRRGLRR